MTSDTTLFAATVCALIGAGLAHAYPIAAIVLLGCAFVLLYKGMK